MLVYRKTAYTGQSDYSVVVVVVSRRERLERKNYTRNAHAHVHNTYVIPYTYYYYTYGGYISPGRGGQRRRNDCRLSSVCHVRRRRSRGSVFRTQRYIIIPRHHDDDGRILLYYYLTGMTGMSRDRHPSGI